MKFDDLFFDKHFIWHPYSSMTDPITCFPVSSTEGCEIILSNGKRLIDGMSSWWSAIHGYNNPSINEALKRQIDQMPHIMFGGITHQPAIDLCKRLLRLIPNNLECIFLADSGSVAIEIALKMSFQYWQARKEKRSEVLALRNGYHGDTLGAMSVCDPKNSMHKLYRGYLPIHKFIPSPKRTFHEKWRKHDGKYLSDAFSKYHKNLAAIILEPIVQGAGGMKFYHPEYLRCVRNLCDKYEILFIADEIATGFGRTGKWFACNYANVSPDILCIGKALTGGTMTLSATISSRTIAETISNSEAGCFMHGPTFMANPLACTAANASLELLENEKWKKQVSTISNQLRIGLGPLISHPKVRDVRVLGAIGVIETFQELNIRTIQPWFVNQGVWIRPYKNIIYLMPPYIIPSFFLEKLIQSVSISLDEEKHFL